MGISVIIPTYNRSKILNKTIQNALAVLQNANMDFEIIIVNDGDNEIFYDDKRIKVVKNTKKGVASARNYGTFLALHENLLFIDDDMLFDEKALEIVSEFFNSNKKNNNCLNIQWTYPLFLLEVCEKNNFGRFLLKINYVNMKGWAKDFEWKENSEYEIPLLASFFLAITKQNFLKVGEYNENYPFAGFEDYDFAIRVKDAGIKTLLNTTTTIYHNEEDRLNILEWMNRRYREGITRAKFVKMNNDKCFIIRHNLVKRTFYELIYSLRYVFFKITKLMNLKALDFLTFPIFKLLTGAHIWKGYKDEIQKS